MAKTNDRPGGSGVKILNFEMKIYLFWEKNFNFEWIIFIFWKEFVVRGKKRYGQTSGHT